MFQATRLHNCHSNPHPALGPPVAVHAADGNLIETSDLALLEELDDVIFGALEGDASALDRSAVLWRQLRETTPEALIEESREQYVRRALAIWDCYQFEPSDTLGRAFAAIEILALLAE